MFLWQLPHFLAIAWMYREDYARAGIRMLPVVEPMTTSEMGMSRIGLCALPSTAVSRQRAVIVRHFAAPRISDYLRITVGTDGQIDRLLSELSEILRGP